MAAYAHPEFLVDTDWVAQHLGDPKVRLVESDEDALLYDTGHIPGAVKVDWFTSLQHPVRRDFVTKEEFEALCSSLGIADNTTVVFYGDKSNWFAVYAFWLFEYYGHKDRKIMNGGRAKWVAEGRSLTTTPLAYPATTYHASAPNKGIRAFREDVNKHLEAQHPLVDVRSTKEYTGELIHMPGYPQEGAQRGGHIPGAVNIPVEPGSAGGRHLQVAGSPARPVPGSRHHAGKGHHRILPYWRTQFAYLVCAALPAGLPQSAQLRRFVDRVGQPGWRAD